MNQLDFLHASARVRAMENALLDSSRINRMLDARTVEDALKVACEAGYDIPPVAPYSGVEPEIAKARSQMLLDISKMSPSREISHIVSLRYDYHNLKCLLKAKTPEDALPLFIDSGRFPASKLAEMAEKADFSGLPQVFRLAAEDALDVLARTKDAQLADFILDRAALTEIKALALAAESPFLIGYAELYIDITNLRVLTRCIRMGLSRDLPKAAFIDGGSVSVSRLFEGEPMDILAEGPYNTGLTAPAAAAGYAALSTGDSLTAFERACDNAIINYLKKARMVAFGEAPLFAYALAKEEEFKALRTVINGRAAGLSCDAIRERLRDAYV